MELDDREFCVPALHLSACLAATSPNHVVPGTTLLYIFGYKNIPTS
jgi:hypothetical protein